MNGSLCFPVALSCDSAKRRSWLFGYSHGQTRMPLFSGMEASPNQNVLYFWNGCLCLHLDSIVFCKHVVELLFFFRADGFVLVCLVLRFTRSCLVLAGLVPNEMKPWTCGLDCGVATEFPTFLLSQLSFSDSAGPSPREEMAVVEPPSFPQLGRLQKILPGETW